MIKLVEPSVKYAASYISALREGLDSAPSKQEDIQLADQNFAAYLAQKNDTSRPVILPDGSSVPRLPQIDLWLIEGDEFIGRASIRPQLNDVLRMRGGNIGYAIRASMRGKGYGHKILTEALGYVRKLGFQEILITCHDQNTASIRIIEKAGGTLIDKIEIKGVDIPERRYKINISP